MARLFGLLRSAPTPSATSQDGNAAEKEIEQLEDAMRSSVLILDDDLEMADRLLSQSDTAFHKLGRGLVIFMKALLSMDSSAVKEANAILSEAEAAASKEFRRAQNNTTTYRSAIYAPGTEFELCIAEAQLMSAVVGIMSESVTETVRGFYRVRKAYLTVQRIVDMEQNYLRKERGTNSRSQSNGGSAAAYQPDSAIDASLPTTPLTESGLRDENGSILSRTFSRTSSSRSIPPALPNSNFSTETLQPGDLLNPIDAFVHSGASLHAGIIQLLLSIIPPTFGRLLSIVGFRGDRDQGLRLLWRATAYPNINGAIASLAILGFYTGFISSLDILPTSGPGSFPAERCVALLVELRSRHPKSILCLMEDVRMTTSKRDPARALKIMEASGMSKLKQIAAMQYWELGLNAMYLHNYAKCAEAFTKAVEISNWSKAVYYYIAGCSHVELYRLYKYGGSNYRTGSLFNVSQDDTKAKHHALTAKSLLQKITENLSKRRMFGKQLPIDVFVARKWAKWNARASSWGVDLVDAIGISPIEEILFFWNGHRRMTEADLQDSLTVLSWNDGVGWTKPGTSTGDVTSNPYYDRVGIDDHATLSLLRAGVHRQLGAVNTAERILKEEIIDKYKWEEFKAIADGDKWPAPVARYEVAICWWLKSEEGRTAAAALAVTAGTVVNTAAGSGPEAEMTNTEKLQECKRWLDVAAQWEPYDLDNRFGSRITTGRDTLAKLGIV